MAIRCARFGTVSLLLLILLAIAPAKNHFSEWRHYQNKYLSLIRGRGDAVSLERRFHDHDGIQQIWLPQLGVVDRCTTCHTALKEVSLADVNTQPFRRHPVIPHTLDQYGCMVCHRGQGVATTMEEAHSSTAAWEQPILPARTSSHLAGNAIKDRSPGHLELNQGRNMLSRYGCVHCHTVKLADGSTMKPTDDPPSLAHIADKTTREWIYRLAERSAGLRRYFDHAELQAERCGRARHLRVPDRRQHTGCRETRRQPPVEKLPTRQQERVCTENPFVQPAMPCRTRPEMWWAGTLVPN